MNPADRDSVAQLYLDSYPPEIGADDLASALDEISATFAGEYGELRTEASLIAHIGSRPAGAIFTTSHSIWDPKINGPFIIDLFVGPTHRGAGAGRALVIEAIKACVANQEEALSLRVGGGTSPKPIRCMRASDSCLPPARPPGFPGTPAHRPQGSRWGILSGVSPVGWLDCSLSYGSRS